MSVLASTNVFSPSLGVYNNPNKNTDMKSTDFDFDIANFNLTGSTFPVFPNFISSYFDPNYASMRAEIGKPILSGDMRVCDGDSVYFKLSRTKAVNEYWWSFGDGTSAHNIKEPIHQYKNAGKYNASLIVRYNCKYDTLYTEVIIDQTTTTPTQIDTIATCENIVLKVPTYYETFRWKTGETTSTIEVNQPGAYTITGTNACEKRSNVYIVQKPTSVLYNVITPNGDGQNDVLRFNNTTVPLSLNVYNRWGKEVYQSSDYQNNWGGEELSEGVYYYNAKYEGCENKRSWLEIIR